MPLVAYPTFVSRYVHWWHLCNLGENAYCGGNVYFASKIKRGPAKLGEDYGRVVPLIQEKEKEKKSWAGQTHAPAQEG